MVEKVKTKKVRSEKHRRFVASQPCIVTHAEYGVQAHHLLKAEGLKGMGTKSCDKWCIPLHFTEHDKLHKNGNELDYFAERDMPYSTVIQAAINLAKSSPDNAIRKAINDYLEFTCIK